MDEIQARIKAMRRTLGLSAEEVAKYIGVSRATYYRYEGSEDQKIPTKILIPLSEVLKTTPQALIGDETESRWIEENTLPVNEVTYLPIIGIVRAGVGGITFEEELGTEFVETSSIKGHSPSEFFWTRVKGDSMEPRLYENDLVLVRKQTSVNNGEYAIVLVDDEEGVVKRVTYDETSVTLHSQNHNYPPRVFEGKEVLRLRIVGKVIKSQSTF